MKVSRWTLLLALLSLSFSLGCRRSPSPAFPASAFGLYRFDDHLRTDATIAGPGVPSAATVADPIIYKEFDRVAEPTWRALRGRMGALKGQLVVRGEGGPPVIVVPKEPVIDWGLYEAVLVRMAAEGGAEIKIKIGEVEMKRPLGPPREYQVYRFDINITAPRGTRPLAIMPTDSNSAFAAIDFVELVPRKMAFRATAGRLFVGKSDEYRNALYAHAPSTITYEIQVPERGRLHFGLGVAEHGKPVTFRVLAGRERKVLFSRTVDAPDAWLDNDVDLAEYARRSTKLVFETTSDSAGAVGLWSNPLLTNDGPKPRPNILIYLVCSLRPDHTSLYGYSRDTTPFLKTLGGTGVVFDDAQAQAPWTKSSVPSLLTSLYSYTAGLRGETGTIPEGATTLAEQLRAAGYVTASIITNPFVGRVSGLDRGFDYVMESPAVMRFHNEETDRGTDSAAVNKVALPWLERHRNQPFFLYAHSSDPHAPYRPPKGFEERFANPAETERFNRDYWRTYDRQQFTVGAVITRESCKVKGLDPDRFIQQAIDRYDGEIALCDRSFEQLVGKLKDLGVLDNTLIIVVSDHGEEFWDHGFTAHGHSLYRELVHSLMLFWNPKLLPTPRRVAETVQLIDLAPTILELIGAQPKGIIQGVSLVPLLKGSPFHRKTPVMASKFAHSRAGPETMIPENRTDAYATWRDRWKLIYRDHAAAAGVNEVELYDRRTDPAEKNNVAAQHPEEVKRLVAEIRQWLQAQDEVRKLLGPGDKSELDKKSIERLRSLGYLGGK